MTDEPKPAPPSIIERDRSLCQADPMRSDIRPGHVLRIIAAYDAEKERADAACGQLRDADKFAAKHGVSCPTVTQAVVRLVRERDAEKERADAAEEVATDAIAAVDEQRKRVAELEATLKRRDRRASHLENVLGHMAGNPETYGDNTVNYAQEALTGDD